VYKALDKRDGKIVAIKVLEIDEQDTTDLQREINILRECHSDYIVQYKGTFEKDKHVWVRVSVLLLFSFFSCRSVCLSVLVSSFVPRTPLLLL